MKSLGRAMTGKIRRRSSGNTSSKRDVLATGEDVNDRIYDKGKRDASPQRGFDASAVAPKGAQGMAAVKAGQVAKNRVTKEAEAKALASRRLDEIERVTMMAELELQRQVRECQTNRVESREKVHARASGLVGKF